jgi:hypothetical protein
VGDITDNGFPEASVAERQQGLPPFHRAGPPMCDKCTAIDRKVLHYRSIVARVTDQLTIERVNKLIDEKLAGKIEFHPKE